MYIREHLTNAKNRGTVFAIIFAALLPPILTISLTDNGALHLGTLGWTLFSIIGILLSGECLLFVLNKPIGLGESFLTLLLFLFANALSFYLYIKGYRNYEDNKRNFIVNLSNGIINFCGSVAQVFVIFYRSTQKQPDQEEERLTRIKNSNFGQDFQMSAHSNQPETSSNETNEN